MSDERRGGFRERRGGFRPSGPREMHKATCADCGKETEVPFKPSGDRPVYC
jgi:CxxC-x17-CxxC domain-containing protein